MRYLIASCLLLCACTSELKTVKTLQKQGFTNIEVTGYDMFACSDSDTFHTGFIATNPQGTQVEGVVCCGWLKRCTVRF